jgi:hypothetical protein
MLPALGVFRADFRKLARGLRPATLDLNRGTGEFELVRVMLGSAHLPNAL